MRFIAGLILVLFISLILQAQTGRSIDSLTRVLETEHEISKRIELYLALCIEYKDVDVNKSIAIANQALILAENIEDKMSTGLLHKQLGDFAMQQDNVELAEEEYKKALENLADTDISEEQIKTHIQLGNRYIEKDNYPEAMNHYLMGIRLSEESGINRFLPNLKNNLGIVYLNMNNHEKALKLYSQALQLFEDLNDTINIAGTTTNIGSIYIQLGDFEVAKNYYFKGLQIFKTIEHRGGEAHALFKLGLLDQLQDNYESALDYLLKSLAIQRSMDQNPTGSKKMFLTETYVNLGIIYLALKENGRAINYLEDGYEMALQTGQYGLIVLASEHLSKYHKENGSFENALEFYEVYKQYSDSLFNEDNVKKLTQIELQHQYETRLRDAELKQLVTEQKRQRLNLIYLVVSVGLLLVIVIGALLLRLEKNKKKKIELEKEKLSGKLDHINKELTTHVMYLLRKNEFILSIIEKLKVARLDAKPENKKIIAELINELKSNTDTVSWEEFEVRFQEVHTDFYKNIHEEFPDLSTNEIRLCAFFRLNMTTKEIAAITYQSLNSIKVARYRLRKKLKLSQNDNLISFLARF